MDLDSGPNPGTEPLGSILAILDDKVYYYFLNIFSHSQLFVILFIIL